MVFNESIENVEQMKLKIYFLNKILNIFHLYCLLISHEKILYLNLCCFFFVQKTQNSI